MRAWTVNCDLNWLRAESLTDSQGVVTGRWAERSSPISILRYITYIIVLQQSSRILPTEPACPLSSLCRPQPI